MLTEKEMQVIMSLMASLAVKKKFSRGNRFYNFLFYLEFS